MSQQSNFSRDCAAVAFDMLRQRLHSTFSQKLDFAERKIIYAHQMSEL